jgi:hypothetical protein
VTEVKAFWQHAHATTNEIERRRWHLTLHRSSFHFLQHNILRTRSHASLGHVQDGLKDAGFVHVVVVSRDEVIVVVVVSVVIHPGARRRRLWIGRAVLRKRSRSFPLIGVFFRVQLLPAADYDKDRPTG